MTECSICKQTFEDDLYEFGLQASGCASYLEADGKIHCHFESCFDGDVFMFYKTPAKIEEGVVCDECIQRLISEEKIYLDYCSLIISPPSPVTKISDVLNELLFIEGGKNEKEEEKMGTY